MEKVAGNYYSVTPMSSPMSPSAGPQSQGVASAALDRSNGIRGMHSGVHKAVEAHRQMVEDRQNRRVSRARGGIDAMEAQQPDDLVVANQVTQSGGMSGVVAANEFENSLIEPIESEAKSAAVQAFQALEPDRPFIGEHIPKGSYIDVQA